MDSYTQRSKYEQISEQTWLVARVPVSSEWEGSVTRCATPQAHPHPPLTLTSTASLCLVSTPMSHNRRDYAGARRTDAFSRQPLVTSWRHVIVIFQRGWSAHFSDVSATYCISWSNHGSFIRCLTLTYSLHDRRLVGNTYLNTRKLAKDTHITQKRDILRYVVI